MKIIQLDIMEMMVFVILMDKKLSFYQDLVRRMLLELVLQIKEMFSLLKIIKFKER